jgi:hypothetical protein
MNLLIMLYIPDSSSDESELSELEVESSEVLEYSLLSESLSLEFSTPAFMYNYSMWLF